MSTIRRIRKILKSKPTIEGAGVHLKRAFGFHQVPQLDPFLLLDDFRSNNPDDYIKGFPWHPHRGIETITYMLRGEVEHGDSLGNKGVISSGDVQWMTAGSGIVHQEIPKGREDGWMWGFQLWANLPASFKMMEPRYREIKNHQIPEVELESGAKIKIICGEVNDVKGPVLDIVIDPEYLDVWLPPETEFTHRVQAGYTVFAYLIEGEGCFDAEQDRYNDEAETRSDVDFKKNGIIEPESVVIFEDGDELTVSTKDKEVRFLLISGKPIKEPVAWRGPIVMNTQEELRIAFEEYQRGTFLKHKKE